MLFFFIFHISPSILRQLVSEPNSIVFHNNRPIHRHPSHIQTPKQLKKKKNWKPAAKPLITITIPPESTRQHITPSGHSGSHQPNIQITPQRPDRTPPRSRRPNRRTAQIAANPAP
jgi:hypothetical protein